MYTHMYIYTHIKKEVPKALRAMFVAPLVMTIKAENPYSILLYVTDMSKFCI